MSLDSIRNSNFVRNVSATTQNVAASVGGAAKGAYAYVSALAARVVSTLGQWLAAGRDAAYSLYTKAKVYTNTLSPESKAVGAISFAVAAVATALLCQCSKAKEAKAPAEATIVATAPNGDTVAATGANVGGTAAPGGTVKADAPAGGTVTAAVGADGAPAAGAAQPPKATT